MFVIFGGHGVKVAFLMKYPLPRLDKLSKMHILRNVCYLWLTEFQKYILDEISIMSGGHDIKGN